MILRCYHCDTNPARYIARVDFDLTPEYRLCEACAIWLRDIDAVIEIRSDR